MKISIVIPAHNEEKIISNTLKAVLTQKYDDYEIIVVDNASTDKTAEIVREYPVILVEEKRKGLLWARERGRLAAKGDIIANMDADCLPENDWLSKGIHHFKDNNIIAVTGPYDYHDGSHFFRISSISTQKLIYWLVNEFLQFSFIKKGAILIGGNNFIRASVLNKTGGYNTSIIFYGEDTDTAKRISTHGKVKFIPSLKMMTSARRFKAEGTINIMLKYWYHFFRTVFKRT